MSHFTANPSTGGLPGRLSYLRQLEAEAIFILREVVAQFENPCMFYSIGKDSTVMLHLARKAFAPGPVPFPLLHVDTTWEFREMAQFRDQLRDRLGLKNPRARQSGRGTGRDQPLRARQPLHRHHENRSAQAGTAKIRL